MSNDIDQIFEAHSNSIYNLFIGSGAGYYIPPYQRPYTWPKKKVFRMIEDAGHGLRMLLKHEDAITFIGSIIFIEDRKKETISPLVKNDLPPKVILVIDGQQRITSLLLTFSAIHNEIQQSIQTLQKKEDLNEIYAWFYRACIDLEGELREVIEIDMRRGEKQFFPRMIRAIDDSWARTSDLEKYTSPIAKYLSDYRAYAQ